jgi:UDP-N-acetylglucosamine 3-dehydrogenase
MPSKTHKKIRAAVIGGGNMGKNHLRNYFMLPEAELVALADINPDKKILADEYKADFFTDYCKMLDKLRPEVVSIVVPTPLHAQVATEVIKRGIHCLLEKPIASTVKEADLLINLAKKHKVILTVGHIEHYNPLVVTLKRLLDNNKVGDITSVVCKRVGGFPPVEPKTDVIIDLAVHDIGIIGYLLNKKPKKINCHQSRTFHSNKIDSAEILLDYGQASGFVQANWVTPVKIRTIAVTGSGGYIEGNYITQELECYEHNMQIGVKGFPNFVSTMGEPKKETMKVDFKEPLAEEIKAFLAVVNGEKDVYLVKPQEAREALKFALLAVKPDNKKGIKK